MAPTEELIDRMAIREILEKWVVWHDAGDWERLRTIWHEDGRITTSWFEGHCDAFIQVSRERFNHGVHVLHSLGGSSIDIEGERAIAQTRMTMSRRAELEGVLCDVVCIGRFYDFLEKRSGRWGLVLRQPIYERDRLDPVDSTATLNLGWTRLMSFPEGYRHLAYLLAGMGYPVRLDVPGLIGPEVDALYMKGSRWLKGESIVALDDNTPRIAA